MVHSSAPPNVAYAVAEDSYASSVVDVAGITVGCLLDRSTELDTIREGVHSAGMLRIEVGNSEELLSGVVSRIYLLDLGAPDACSAAAELRSSHPKSALIGVARDASEERAALQFGFDIVVRKPVDPTVLALYLLRTRERLRTVDSSRSEVARISSLARADAVQHLASAMGHELNGPLSVAYNNAAMLCEQLQADRSSGSPRWEELQAMAGDVLQAMEHLVRRVRQMRSLTHATHTPSTRVRLADVVHQAIASVPNAAGVVVRVELESDEYALAVAEPLQQAVENLLANAFHALRHAEAPDVLVRVYRRSAEARISVRDNGPGVPAALRERVFEPFFTTKGAEGTGMGLAISREFVVRMGGALTLASGGPGACFRIRMRAA